MIYYTVYTIYYTVYHILYTKYCTILCFIYNHRQRFLPKGRSFTANSGARAAVLSTGRSPPQT